MTNVVVPPSFGERRRVVGRRREPAPVLLPQMDAADLALRAQEQEIVELQRQLAECQSTLAALQTEADLATQREQLARQAGVDAGYAEGVLAGTDKAELDFEKRTTEIRAAVADALALYEAALVELTGLSQRIALTAVQHVLGDSTDRASVVGEIISRQVDLLRDAAPLRIRVSAADFKSDEALQDAVRGSLAGAVDLVRDPELSSGNVQIKLQLGYVEAGIDQQLAALNQLLGAPDAA